jgi:phenylalanyl-tRNA synthetase beta chain
MAQECTEVPVVNLDISRLKEFIPDKPIREIIDALPFIALDIESVDDEKIRVEYNPNRPDYSSDYGIVRALKGYFELETGIPEFKLWRKSKYKIKIDPTVSNCRPFIVGLVAKNGKLNELTIGQLIAMQEDLHNGIGRRRLKASVGIHNFDAIRFPVKYTSMPGDFTFRPLGFSSEITIRQILATLDTGKQYGYILMDSDNYPLLLDAHDNVLSFPPITNSELTKIDKSTSNLFVEVTATDQKIAEDILANLAITLFEIGFEIHAIWIERAKRIEKLTPDMTPSHILVETGEINKILGTTFGSREILKFLDKTRLGAKLARKEKESRAVICTIPRYRVDIFDASDISEEVAIGYGIDKFAPSIPSSTNSGNKNGPSIKFNMIREVMVGLGMLEVNNFSLVNKKMQYEQVGREYEQQKILAIEGTKNLELEILRDSLMPSLIQTLSRNLHEPYPQNIFEIGKVFRNQNPLEHWTIAALAAHSQASFTYAKSLLETMLKMAFGKFALTEPDANLVYEEGRCAKIIVDRKSIGNVGEISTKAKATFKLRMPVSGYELNLSELLALGS